MILESLLQKQSNKNVDSFFLLIKCLFQLLIAPDDTYILIVKQDKEPTEDKTEATITWSAGQERQECQ